MTKITPRVAQGWSDESSDPAQEDGFAPLTAEQAREWRQKHPQLPIGRVLAVQAVTGLVVVLLAWLWTGRPMVVWSAAYGAVVAVLPSALSARGMARWAAPGFPPAAALGGFLLWEGVKLVLTMGMLMAAPRILGAPNWPALLVSLVLTIKVYWVALLLAQMFRSGARGARR